MRCWICHSEYVIVADHFPAPSLRTLYERHDDDSVRVVYVKLCNCRFMAEAVIG